MDTSALVSDLERFGAPLIARLLSSAAYAIGGPVVGGITSFVLNALAAALGARSAAPADIQAQLEADPDKARAVLPKVEADHADLIGQAMAQAEIDERNIESARGLTVDLAKAGSPLAWGSPLISIVVVLAFALLAGLVAVRYGLETPIGQLIAGALIAKFGTVVDYWLGSSKGSSERVDQIVAMLKAQVAPAPARKGR